MKESGVASHIRLEAANSGIELWRNNVGVLRDENGRPIRYGLANDTAALNKNIKSSDFIGITPVQAYVEGIGWTVLGVFTAIETKAEDWKFYQSDERALAQQAFHDIVRKAGGFAGFARNITEFRRIIGREKS